jgi:uncharacterized protein YbjT (DUF2867 family)
MTEIPAETLVTVFGGSGFLGRHVVRALAREGYRVRNAVRRPDLAGHLQPLGRVGQIHSVQANLRYPESVFDAVSGADAVINLVGILFERGKQRFDAVHAEGAHLVAQAAAGQRARLVHVSALGANSDSTAAYARAKAAGEAAVLGTIPDAIILRPSVIFGPEDHFFNRFAALARLSPALPRVGRGVTKFQPVFVGDVAQAVARAVGGRVPGGTIYELGGPEVKTFRELMEYVLTVTERRRLLIPVPFKLAKLKATFLQLLPTPLLTPDQVELMRTHTIVSPSAEAEGRTFRAFGIEPAALEAIVPSYLWRFRKSGLFRGRVANESR